MPPVAAVCSTDRRAAEAPPRSTPDAGAWIAAAGPGDEGLVAEAAAAVEEPAWTPDYYLHEEDEVEAASPAVADAPRLGWGYCGVG